MNIEPENTAPVEDNLDEFNDLFYGKEKPEPVEEKPVAEWKELSTAEIKALWNVTKKPSEFASLLLAKVKEKNYEWRP